MWIPFMDNVNSLFQHRFCYTQLSAGSVITIAYLVAVGLSLPLGFVVDTWGQRRILAVIGMGVFLTGQLIILAYPQC
jgi:MFS family permease